MLEEVGSTDHSWEFFSWVKSEQTWLTCHVGIVREKTHLKLGRSKVVRWEGIYMNLYVRLYIYIYTSPSVISPPNQILVFVSSGNDLWKWVKKANTHITFTSKLHNLKKSGLPPNPCFWAPMRSTYTLIFIVDLSLMGETTWRIIPVSKWLITMVIVSPLRRVVPLPNGR